jgi:hypothetical protein
MARPAGLSCSTQDAAPRPPVRAGGSGFAQDAAVGHGASLGTWGQSGVWFAEHSCHNAEEVHHVDDVAMQSERGGMGGAEALFQRRRAKHGYSAIPRIPKNRSDGRSVSSSGPDIERSSRILGQLDGCRA